MAIGVAVRLREVRIDHIPNSTADGEGAAGAGGSGEALSTGGGSTTGSATAALGTGSAGGWDTAGSAGGGGASLASCRPAGARRPVATRTRLAVRGLGFVAGKVCPPRKKSKSGMLSLNWLVKDVKKRWMDLRLRPITLQEARHTAATWLDHAGVPPKVASEFMGHKAPSRHLYPDAAPITLRRYTHVLDGELRRAAEKLEAFIAEREAEEADHEFHIPA